VFFSTVITGRRPGDPNYLDCRVKPGNDVEERKRKQMLYAIYCTDKPNHLQTRLDNRPAHVEYLKSFGGQHICTGPLLSDDGQGMVGSLLVMDFVDRKAVEDFAANDPYAKAGLFQSIAITPFRKVFPQA
jgi:uncharacterized protein YciI